MEITVLLNGTSPPTSGEPRVAFINHITHGPAGPSRASIDQTIHGMIVSTHHPFPSETETHPRARQSRPRSSRPKTCWPCRMARAMNLSTVSSWSDIWEQHPVGSAENYMVAFDHIVANMRSAWSGQPTTDISASRTAAARSANPTSLSSVMVDHLAISCPKGGSRSGQTLPSK